MLERCQTHNRLELVHFAVDTYGRHLILTAESEVAHGSTGFREFVVIGNNCSTFEGIQKLRGMKTKHFGTTKAPHHDSVAAATDGVGGVEKQNQVVSPANGGQRFNIACMPPEMNSDDPSSSRR